LARRFIAVAGNIGVGKTTLVEYLTHRYPLKPIYEPFDTNPYLDDFYADMRQWSFHSQMWFLSHKYRLHCQIEDDPGTFVQDRTIYEDAEIFATHLHRSRRMKKRDFETYLELYHAMRDRLQPPDLLIHLKCSVRAIRRRVRQRGRPSEQDIPASYLRKLNDLYEEWIGEWKHSPVLVWDTERMDYLSDLVHQLEFDRALQPFVG
jgi:deoxyadenosine/deoxycytidine kinase